MHALIGSFLLLFTSPVWAVNYSGLISKNGTQIQILEEGERKLYTLNPATPLIADHLTKLSAGDFLSLDGQKDYARGVINVRSINYLGLSKLIGTWFGDDSHCYIFSSFTEFSIARKIGNRCLTPNKPGYTYLLNPSNENWVIIISAQHGGNYIGDIRFLGPEEAEIQLYDPETGDTLRYVNLRK